MLRWFVRVMFGLVVTALLVIGTGPWLLYAIGLSMIDGRPSHASQAPVASEEVDAFWRRLRTPRPDHIDPLSPHSYTLALLRADQRALEPAGFVAWPIACSYNVDHLGDHRAMLAWHLSGAALTIWLTRNWTTDELVAKAVELDNAAAKARAAATRRRMDVPANQAR